MSQHLIVFHGEVTPITITDDQYLNLKDTLADKEVKFVSIGNGTYSVSSIKAITPIDSPEDDQDYIRPVGSNKYFREYCYRDDDFDLEFTDWLQKNYPGIAIYQDPEKIS